MSTGSIWKERSYRTQTAKCNQAFFLEDGVYLLVVLSRVLSTIEWVTTGLKQSVFLPDHSSYPDRIKTTLIMVIVRAPMVLPISDSLAVIDDFQRLVRIYSGRP